MTVEYLRELIEKNARIILPDFGAFLVKDDGTGTFKAENISFSPFLRYNDGIMVDHLCKHYSLSREEASKKLKEFIEHIKEELLNNNEFEIPSLGYLNRDARGGVHFTAKTSEDESPKISKEIEKSTSKSSPRVKKESAEAITEKKTVEKQEDKPVLKHEPVKEPEVKKNATNEESKVQVKSEKPEMKPDISTHKNVKQSQDKAPKPKPVTTKKEKTVSGGWSTGKAILIGSLIGVVLFVMVAGVLYLNKSGYFDFNSATEVVEESQGDINPEKDLQFEDQAVEEVKEEKGKFDEEFEKMSSEMDAGNEKTVTEEPKIEPKKQDELATPAESTSGSKDIIPTSEGPFHLIVGSFRNTEYAEKFSADMRKSGYDSKVVIQASGMHSVTLGSYSTREDALKAMDQFKSQHPSVWLLTQ